ncbi:hypothetical protein ACFO9Q_20660 [Paenibacillus sp. GCM10023252]|uniref:hypothetical protein n=1 Tax=Paenibacillus sp. GCM10023252 TaxID=3252649 RepID=UPI003605DF02
MRSRPSRFFLMLLILCVLAAVVTTCLKKRPSEPPASLSILPPHRYGAELAKEPQLALRQFIDIGLTGPDGIYTNYFDTDQASEQATGHEVLSESAGLTMRAAALNRGHSRFDEAWEQAKRTFDLTTGFSYRYSPKLAKRYTLNAAVDDLRMIRALYEASEIFTIEKYKTLADTYSRRFFLHNVKNGYLYDFYDETYKITNSFITLCYIDLLTLKQLPIPLAERQTLLTNMQNLASEGYLTDEFPFYETRYDYSTQAYSNPTHNRINTVESLLTILHLAEVQAHQPASIAYLKERVTKGDLYGQYTREGVPTTTIQSTAIYAIAAMIFSQVGDVYMYKESIARMNQYQVQQEGSPLNGGFGDPATGQAYSFDNLMAQLAYAY